MTKELTRRSFLKTGIGGTAAGLAAFSLTAPARPGRGRRRMDRHL